MFSKKRFVVFISKQFIDPGFVTIGSEPFFDGGEAFRYTKETLADGLKKIQTISKEKMRIVLGEEFVYVTELSFPHGTTITRELVREKAEEVIPENLKQTEWDFQTLHYKEKTKDTDTILVQVAVIEKSFSESFRQALAVTPLSIEAIYPESYVLANLEIEESEVVIIIEQDRELTVLCAVLDGFVVATRVKKDAITTEDVRGFLSFLSTYKGKSPKKIFLSHCGEENLLKDLSLEGYEVRVKEYNPLVGAALLEKISGEDEEILNIDIFSSIEKKAWWRIFK